MLSLQEISDRIELNDLIVRYSYAIDNRDFDALDDIFTEDAIIDYTAMGGARGTVPETKAYLTAALARFTGFQHLVATTIVKIEGDTATARTICHNPMMMMHKGAEHIFFCGLWYNDEFRRTDKGWRISHRNEDKSFFYNLPTDFAPIAVE